MNHDNAGAAAIGLPPGVSARQLWAAAVAEQRQEEAQVAARAQEAAAVEGKARRERLEALRADFDMLAELYTEQVAKLNTTIDLLFDAAAAIESMRAPSPLSQTWMRTNLVDIKHPVPDSGFSSVQARYHARLARRMKAARGPA